MPCYIDPPTEAERNGYGDLSERQAKAVLCGLLTASPDALSKVDWDQVGVPEKLVRKWWKKHQAEDALKGVMFD